MTYDRPFRLRVLDAVQAALLAGVPDIGQEVWIGRFRYGDDEPLPLISILEPPLAIDQVLSDAEDNENGTGEWDLLVQGWANDDDMTDPLKQAYTLAAHVRAVLITEKTRLKGRTNDPFGMGPANDGVNCITRMRVGAPIVRPADETSSRASFYLPLTFTLAEDINAPFE